MKQLNIALDYDGTYTEDPQAFRDVVNVFHKSGHKVYVVTMRKPEEKIDSLLEVIVDDVIYTSRKAKMDFCRNMGVKIDIWIDDMPVLVLIDAKE